MGLKNTKFEGAVKPDAISVDSYEPDIYAKRVVEIPANLQTKIFWDGNKPEYIGFAPKGMATSADGWLIYKYEYSSGKISSKTLTYGILDDRATLTFE